MFYGLSLSCIRIKNFGDIKKNCSSRVGSRSGSGIGRNTGSFKGSYNLKDVPMETMGTLTAGWEGRLLLPAERPFLSVSSLL